MAHEIEQSADGTAAFVSAREHAWHGLGVVLPESFTAADAMRQAHLGGWNVHKIPLQTVPVPTRDGLTVTLPVPDRYATVRTNPFTGALDVLGDVGADYTPVQNEAHAQVLDAIVDESGAHFETAGSLRGGRQVFLTMKLPTTMLIGGQDAVDLYLVAVNSHDGSGAFRLVVTPVRVVCANTLAAGLRKARSTFGIRHTSGAAAHIAQARQALGLTFAYAEEFQAEADRMIEEQLTDDEFDRIVAHLWPVTTPTARTGQAETRARTLHELRHGSPTLTADLAGTRWGAYQAVTEYIDHYAPTRGRVDQTAARAERAAIGGGPALKARAFDLFKA